MVRWTPGVGKVIVCLAALLCIAPSTASAVRGPATDGIDHARSAGIVVDPDVESIMAQAPPGSCLNDPAQAKCPTARKIVAAATHDMPDGSVGYALTEDTSASTKARVTRVRRHRARAHAAVDACYLKADYPYYSNGYMWGLGTNTCLAEVTTQELYTSLWRTNTASVWQLLDTKSGSGPGGTTLRRTANYNCYHLNLRHYKTLAEGYANLKGVWYAASQNKTDYHTCPNT